MGREDTKGATVCVSSIRLNTGTFQKNQHGAKRVMVVKCTGGMKNVVDNCAGGRRRWRCIYLSWVWAGGTKRKVPGFSGVGVGSGGACDGMDVLGARTFLLLAI